MKDFRGSHDFQGERKGNQSSPTEVKIKRSEVGNWIFNFIFTSSQGPIIIKHGGGGWWILEDHMTFGGKGREISRRRQSLK